MHESPINWRDHIDVHPAAEMFPLMSEPELRELGEDIKKNGLASRVVMWRDQESEKDFVLDGRNRLDAMARASLDLDINKHFEWRISTKTDPYEYVISANIHRRHLTAEQKDELIAKLLKATPEKSNRQIAKTVGKSHPHVAKVRKKLEKSGDVETVTTSIDTKGRRQPARRLKHANPDCPDCGGNGYFNGGDSGRCHCHGSRPKTSTPPDNSSSGVSQVSTAPEKLSSGLPTGSDSSKNPVQQAEIAESETQPNPILEAFNASTVEQRQEFIEGQGDFIADWNAIASSRKKDAPLKYRIWSSCTEIEMGIDGEFDKGYWLEEYESIADQLSKLEQAINEAEAEDEEEDEEEDEKGPDPDDDLNIPDYL